MAQEVSNLAPAVLIIPKKTIGAAPLHGQIIVSGGYLYYASGAAWYFVSGAQIQPMG